MKGLVQDFTAVAKRLGIGAIVSVICWLLADAIFEAVVMFNATNHDVAIGDVGPFILIALTWVLVIRSVRKYFRKKRSAVAIA